MTDEQSVPPPNLDEAPGWVIRDPDGNVVDSGPLVIAQPAFQVGEPSDTEGEQE